MVTFKVIFILTIIDCQDEDRLQLESQLSAVLPHLLEKSLKLIMVCFPLRKSRDVRDRYRNAYVVALSVSRPVSGVFKES